VAVPLAVDLPALAFTPAAVGHWVVQLAWRCKWGRRGGGAVQKTRRQVIQVQRAQYCQKKAAPQAGCGFQVNMLPNG